MKPENVKPNAWKDIIVLYNNINDNYSIIIGTYNGNRCIGGRWNGGKNERGYPGQGSDPTLYVEPEFLTLPILNELLKIATERKEDIYINRIINAIKEFE